VNNGSDCFYFVCESCAGGIPSLGNNLIGNPAECNIPLLARDLVADPGLGDFTDDSTPGREHFPLLAFSEGIDAGNDEVCPTLISWASHGSDPAISALLSSKVARLWPQ